MVNIFPLGQHVVAREEGHKSDNLDFLKSKKIGVGVGVFSSQLKVKIFLLPMPMQMPTMKAWAMKEKPLVLRIRPLTPMR